MIHFLSSPLWFSHFRSLPVILSSNCPSLFSLFLNSLSTYNNLLFDLPFPLISPWPPYCILLLVTIPSFFNYFIFYFLSTLHISSSFSFAVSGFNVITSTFAASFYLSSPPFFSTGPEYILDATSTVCYATYSKFSFIVWVICYLSTVESFSIFSSTFHCLAATQKTQSHPS